MSASIQSLLNTLHSGALVITPNQRLSHFLKDEFAKQFPQTVQAQPACLPYPNFLTLCYDLLISQHAFTYHPSLLKPHQTQMLWEQILSDSSAFIAPTVINAALSAWQNCHHYHLPIQHPAFKQNPQTQTFQSWAFKFEKKLKKLNAITAAQLVNYLKSFNLVFPYKHIIFACFDFLHPNQKEIQEWLNHNGVTIENYDLSPHQQDTYWFAAEDEKSEQQSLFEWLKHTLNSSNSIGIVVPSLTSNARQLKRALQLYFPKLSVHVSLGEPLAHYPLITHALQWLQLKKPLLTQEEIVSLLYSPYLADETEQEARTFLMTQHSELKVRQLSYQTFIQILIPTCPQLAHKLQTLPAYPTHKDTPTNWVKHFTNRLIHLGFPGQTPLNSTTYQTYERFLNLLDSFKELSFISPHIDQDTSLHLLIRLATESLFQPEAPPHPQVQIFGLLEASGLQFEHLWIMGLTDQCFPSQLTPTPFIPFSLQQTYALPHTSLTHENHLAQLRLNRFQNASQHTILSYPITETLNRPSPLITVYSAYLPLMPEAAAYPYELEYYEENTPLPPLPQETLPHGSSILADQAKCAFRAFAAQRLHLSEPEPLTEGLSAKTRGILVHQILEKLWQTLQTQNKLLSLDTTALDAILHPIIEKALMRQLSPDFPKVLAALEHTRLYTLIHQALTWEKTRPAFKVDELESRHTLQLGPLQFKLRLDRMDKLDTGEKWVIDYKTSLPSPLPWNSDEPLEPQLLMYALIDPTIQAIFFYELKKGHVRIKGLSGHAYEDKQITTLKEKSWEEITATWRGYLTQLAVQFHEGQCTPLPATPTLCATCPYQDVCRLPFKTLRHIQNIT